MGGVGTPIAYSPASQVASLTRSNTAYLWPGASNATVAYAANGLNQYTAVGGSAVSYDGKGDLTASGGASFGYSPTRLLTSWSNGAYPSGLYMEYGPLDELQTYGAANLVYDGVNLSAEYAAGSSSPSARYVYGPGVDEPIVAYAGAGAAISPIWPDSETRILLSAWAKPRKRRRYFGRRKATRFSQGMFGGAGSLTLTYLHFRPECRFGVRDDEALVVQAPPVSGRSDPSRGLALFPLHAEPSPRRRIAGAAGNRSEPRGYPLLGQQVRAADRRQHSPPPRSAQRSVASGRSGGDPKGGEANIKGRRMWLWRAVDDEGEVLDVLVQKRRNTAAAMKLIRRLLRN